MTRLLVDNSVLQRLARSAGIAEAVRSALESGGVLCSSEVSRLEAGYSARSVHEHAEIIDRLTIDFELLPLSAETGVVAAELQSALFEAGQGRAVGVVDLLHAATAICHRAVVLHYDADFEVLADVDGRLRHRWVVPRGSVD